MLFIGAGSSQVILYLSWYSFDTVWYTCWASLLGGGILASQRNLGESLRQLGMWVVIFAVLSAVYVFKDDAQNFASRLTAGLIPGRSAELSDWFADATGGVIGAVVRWRAPRRAVTGLA